MSDKVRLNIFIEPDADEMLSSLAGGERLRGEYISNLIRQAHATHNRQALATRIDAVAYELELSAEKLRALAGISKSE